LPDLNEGAGMPDKKTSLLWLLVGSIIGATLCAIFFLNRPGVDHWKMDTQQAAFWDILVKGFTAVLAITGASLAVIKYFSDREEHNATARRESLRGLLEKRQEVYFSLGEAVANIMNHDPGDPEWDTYKEDFFRIYWGALPLVSDKEVASSVERFSEALYAITTGKKDLTDLSLAVSQACRVSLGNSWDVKQPKIEERSFAPAMVVKPGNAEKGNG
jgi:hypothetical protein